MIFVLGQRLAGQVGIVHSSKGFAPRMIRLITGSNWSHVVVAINERECVSAEPGGAVVRPIADYPAVIWSQFRLSGYQRKVIAFWALMHKGTPYSWMAYYGAGLAALLKDRTPNWLDRYVDRTDKLICSQLADRALQAGGINLFQDSRPRGAVTPASFGRYFYERGWTALP